MREAGEMLALAAKAAGVVVVRSRLDDPTCTDFLIEKSPRNMTQKLGPWNPRADDGDCARMEAALGISIQWEEKLVEVFHEDVGYMTETYLDHGGDRNAARRTASTRIAAALGRAMP